MKIRTTFNVDNATYTFYVKQIKGKFVGNSPSIRGCTLQGDTEEELRENILNKISSHNETMKAQKIEKINAALLKLQMKINREIRNFQIRYPGTSIKVYFDHTENLHKAQCKVDHDRILK